MLKSMPGRPLLSVIVLIFAVCHARTASVQSPVVSPANSYVRFSSPIDLGPEGGGVRGGPGLGAALNSLPSLGLVSGDFDGDGVQDLVSSYGGDEGGMIVMHRGSAGADRRDGPAGSPEAQRGESRAPRFFPAATEIALPERPDFIGAGDFDADGNLDLVAARRGGHLLHWVIGDGKGAFREIRRVDVPGTVTALRSADINRVDGLADVIVGVAGGRASHVLVFESPDGALRSAPEAIPIPDVAADLQAGDFDEDFYRDLAVAAGSQLIVIRGRDRKLSYTEDIRAQVQPAFSEGRRFSSAIASIAAGNFGGDHQPGLALLLADGTVEVIGRGRDTGGSDSPARPSSGIGGWAVKSVAALPAVSRSGAPAGSRLVTAHISAAPSDCLVIADQAGEQLQIWQPGVPGGFDSRATDPQTAEGMWFFLRTAGGAKAVLPMNLNGDALSDLIILKAGPGTGQAPLVAFLSQAGTTLTVTSTADSGAGSLRQAIIDANSNPGLDAIVFNIPGEGIKTISPLSALPSLTDPVVIDATTQPGFAGKPLIELEGSRTGGPANGFDVMAPNCAIRGFIINRFAGAQIEFGFQIYLRNTSGHNIIAGNYILTDRTGTALAPDPVAELTGGINVSSPDNLIGGTAAADRNVICNKLGPGIDLYNRRNAVQGNYIGLDAAGQAFLGTSFVGINLFGSGNTIGGAASGAGNVIANNVPYSIDIRSNEDILIQGNYFGLNAAGTAVQPAESRNLSALHFGEGNRNITIGGTSPAARNVISGYKQYGLDINVSYDVLIQGNYIGTDPSGTVALGNSVAGINLGNTQPGLVGGTAAGAGNVIGGSNDPSFGHGILIYACCVGIMKGTRILGNYIGTDVSGTKALGNKGAGIFFSGVTDVVVGGTEPGAGNLIGFNGRAGIAVGLGWYNPLRGNRFIGNLGLGIDLAPGDNICTFGPPSCYGVTPNDPGDEDRGGNFGQNFPVLSSASGGSAVSVRGTLNSLPGAKYIIDVYSSAGCHPAGYGEGENYLGSTTVTTDGSGNADFVATLSATAAIGQTVIATATDEDGNTSEFSQCLTITRNCAFTVSSSVSSADRTFNSEEGSGSLAVAADGDCFWAAESRADWLVITSGRSGSGAGTVHFSVAANSDPSPRTAAISVAGQLITIRQAGRATNVSAASFVPDSAAPEAIVAAFGSGLAKTTQVATTVPLPTSLGGARVIVRDAAGLERSAPIFFASPGQINYLIPPETGLGPATVIIEVDGEMVATGPVEVNDTSAGVFSADTSGRGLAAALVLRVGSGGEQIYEPMVVFDPGSNSYRPIPIDPGVETDQVFLLLFGTGMRRSTTAGVAVSIGGAAAEALFVGAQGTFVGLDQVNVRLPRSLAGRGVVDVELTVEGKPANPVQISVK